jgi:hypothetical protein
VYCGVGVNCEYGVLAKDGTVVNTCDGIIAKMVGATVCVTDAGDDIIDTGV